MDWKLELVVVPVSDLDRAKAFYTEQAGFLVDVDRQVGPDFRVIQLSPPGSACSIFLSAGSDAAGSVQGLHLSVSDIEAARAELVARGTNVGELFHFEEGGQTAGPDPQRGDADRQVGRYRTSSRWEPIGGRGILVQGGDPRCRCSR